MKIMNTKELGAFIRQERRDQKLTQLDLAAFCGVSLRFIIDVEKGKETSQLGKVLLLLNGLGFDLNLSKRGLK